MDVLSHLPPTFFFSQQQQQQQHQHQHQPPLLQTQHSQWTFPPRKLIITASSTKPSSRGSVEVKKGKTVKSNAELCNEIREFVSMVGLPQGYVPTFNDLVNHGRKDLAHIVRRRGYKLITERLTNSAEGDTTAEMSSADKQKARNSYENDSFVTLFFVKGQEQEVSEVAETETGGSFSSENGVLPLISGAIPSGAIESGTSSSLLEKASKFVKDGDLDIVKDADHESDIGHGTSSTNVIGEEKDSAPSGGNSSNYVAAGNIDTSKMNASASTSNVVPPFETRSDGFLSPEGFKNAQSQKDLDDQNSARDNEPEIIRLKAMLHQKELELCHLKKQIEKEKVSELFALTTLQAKTEDEIGKAQKIMSAKDEELHDVEDSLSGLKEVQIEYCGHGETVEVAGSFNGWHHRIEMECQPLPMSVSPIELRKSRLWSTVLWLYPGVYEIKFVVDGHWMIDPIRESVSRGAIQNNILRVAR
ncbi:hypothetical protein IFM89_028911 [Coptis chinensis]|uniref:AMP-activated protein kinase glycogen-binding domain-containing protein n=1 Tax=Coptis chinensis TaxID=261450 RepID=A0A835H7I5_9MAGN|nr:hypothetical protein IFM89_028911 [Coptis chinensis]